MLNLAEPEKFALVRHFYGISSTAGLIKAVMNDAAQAADALGLHDVADAIRAAFLDDVSTSLDDLRNFLHSRRLPIIGFALTGTKPDDSLSPTNHILVGGWYWFPETDMTQLHTPTIYQGKKVKGRLKN